MVILLNFTQSPRFFWSLFLMGRNVFIPDLG